MTPTEKSGDDADVMGSDEEGRGDTVGGRDAASSDVVSTEGSDDADVMADGEDGQSEAVGGRDIGDDDVMADG